MKILNFFIIIAVAMIAAGCAADHNDAVMPGYYDGYHIPPVAVPSNPDLSTPEPAGLNDALNDATNAPVIKTYDVDE